MLEETKCARGGIGVGEHCFVTPKVGLKSRLELFNPKIGRVFKLEGAHVCERRPKLLELKRYLLVAVYSCSVQKYGPVFTSYFLGTIA